MPDPVVAPPLSIPPACQVVGLRKAFGRVQAVAGLDLHIPRGLLYAFLGPNGAGKTTSIRMIAGLLRPDAGEVYIDGVSLASDPVRAKQPLAYVPDDPVLYGKLRPLEYLEFVAALWAMPATEAQTRAEQWLRDLGLWEKRSDKIEEFSRGMRQKLALAGALLHEPRLLLLDEPLTGLDAAAARLVKDILQAFVRRGNSVILTTHILEVAERLADRIGIIQSGALLAEGTLDDLRLRAGSTGGTLEDVFLQLTQAVPEAPPPLLP
ncbi:MAG: ABC transporter ATP-binding protein [Opitutaceae bacterium]|nr:ABC transporter ATP-binding protein [Opitutaceae bacterium]